MKKIWLMLETLQVSQHEHLLNSHVFPPEVMRSNARISKGENYQGLPYLVLDQPRFFEEENTCAIRTLFWWGHFFSVTLQLSGRYKNLFEQKLYSKHGILSQRDYFLGISEDPWQHHFEPTNYLPVMGMKEEEFQRRLAGHPFIKLACRYELNDMDSIDMKLNERFSELTGMLKV